MDKSKLDQLLMLENRILDDRKELVIATRDIDNVDEDFIKNKISMLEQELDNMSKQISCLKEEYLKTTSNVDDIVQREPKVSENKNIDLPMVAAFDTNNTYYDNSKMAQKYLRKVEDINGDLEEKFGKSFMGIAASVLIFISIILFATLLLPMFGDGAKMAIMYAVSGAFLGIGAYRLYKDKDNRFNIALTGCGLGAMYISLLLSNIYFGVIGIIPLYILIALWGGAVSVFAKNRNHIFQIIGEAGILLATIFGEMELIFAKMFESKFIINYEVESRFLALIIFYAITSAIFYLVNYEKEYKENIYYHIFAMIGGGVLASGCMYFIDNDNANICLIIVLIIQILNMIGLMSHKLEQPQESFGVIAAVEMICLTIMSQTVITNEKIWGLIAYVAGMLMVFIISTKKCKDKASLEILTALPAGISLIGLWTNGPAYNYGVVFLMIIPLLVYGYIRRCSLIQYDALFIMGIYMFIYDMKNEGVHFLLMLIAFIVAYILMFRFKEQYNKIYKLILHGAAMIFIGIQMSGTLRVIFGDGDLQREVINTIVYTCFFLWNAISYKSRFADNLLTGEKEEDEEVYTIVNLIAMGAGLILLLDADVVVCHFVNMLVVVAAFMIDTKKMLNQNVTEPAFSMYVGGKFTVLLVVLLVSFDSPNYIISILCLLLAIALILVGFAGGYKYLRIYGLGLTMVSIFKLLMIDITYENTLGNAISFFVSGILCFAISMIYNYLDKKMNGEDDKNQVDNEQGKY